MHGAVRFPPDRRSGACDDSLVSAAPCRRCLPSDSGGWCWGWGVGTKFFFSGHPCMPSASFLEGRVAACSFLGSGVATRPYHTVCPTPIPVVCLSLVIRAAHTDLVRPLSFRSATLLASYFAFQVIRRPAAPIEFCRPHAPTGLELDPIHYLEYIFILVWSG